MCEPLIHIAQKLPWSLPVPRLVQRSLGPLLSPIKFDFPGSLLGSAHDALFRLRLVMFLLVFVCRKINSISTGIKVGLKFENFGACTLSMQSFQFLAGFWLRRIA